MTPCVLFDLDETLLDRASSLRAFVQWQVDGMLRDQITNPAQFIQRFIQLDNGGKTWKDEVYSRLIEEFSIKHWAVTDLLQTYELCFCAFCVAREGIQSALEYLETCGIRMAIVTNGKSPFQERNARSLPEYRYFDAIVVSEAVGIRKPDLEIFQLACKTLSADIAESVFVGDNPIADIQGAKQAGMKTIYVPLEQRASPCVEADSTVSDLFELPGVLEKLLA